MAAKSASGTRRLVIVESPAKAKTIQGYLGPGYVVHSSVGHIRDLPKSGLPGRHRQRVRGHVRGRQDKKKKVAELRKELARADELLLATDEDREGEAIAWHLSEVLKPSVPVRRMVFNEITPDAIRAAADPPASWTWRWSTPRSAAASSTGSTATRSRRSCGARSPRARRPAGCSPSRSGWSSIGNRSGSRSAARRTADVGALPARPVRRPAGRRRRPRVATGKDFDDPGHSRPRTSRSWTLLRRRRSRRRSTARLQGPAVEQRPRTRRPAAPFMTSTLQQEGGRRLRWTSRRTMSVAQRCTRAAGSPICAPTPRRCRTRR